MLINAEVPNLFQGMHAAGNLTRSRLAIASPNFNLLLFSQLLIILNDERRPAFAFNQYFDYFYTISDIL